MNTYLQTCKQHVIDTLPDYEGQEVEACDLGMTLSESENASGSWYCSTYEAEKDLDKFGRDVVAKFIEDYEWQFGDKPQYDAYCEPEIFHCLMMIMGVEHVVNDLVIIQKHWNKKIKLTKRTISAMIKELQ